MPHIHDKIDFTVEVFVVFKNKVLLRKHDKYKKWLSVGGHIEFNEDPNEAAIREVKEEVGLDIELDDSLRIFREKDHTKELIPPYFLNRNRISNTHEHVTLIYFAKSDTNVISETIESEKSKECKWFTKNELIKNRELIPNIKFYALKALEKLST
ncbi:MAG: NUDIX domain-containing protein [Candidatus Levybacteria bacterium]|nr:NUDIX domain-containing protein [Candidatus Levybacteria bacterium]